MNLKQFKPILLLFIGLFILAGCKKKGVDPDGGDGAPSLKGADLAATLNFENGSKVDIKHKFMGGFLMLQPTLIQPDKPKGDEGSLYIITTDLSGNIDYSISIFAVIDGKGKYSWVDGFDEDDDDTGAYIFVSVASDDSSDTYYPMDFAGQVGTSVLDITSISKNKIKGSFSATLYSISTGEKLIVNGQFDSGLSRVSENIYSEKIKDDPSLNKAVNLSR